MGYMEKRISSNTKKIKKVTGDISKFEQLEEIKNSNFLYNEFIRNERKRLLDAWMYSQH
jgi:hypothetical protein